MEIISIGVRVPPATRITPLKKLSPPISELNDVDNVDNVDRDFTLDDAVEASPEKLAKALAVIDEALDICKECPSVLFEGDFCEAYQYLYDSNKGQYWAARDRVKRGKPSGVTMEAIDELVARESSSKEEISVAADLIKLCLERGELYYDGNTDKSFIHTDGQMLNIETKVFIDWLSMVYYNDTRGGEREYGQSASEQNIKQARFALAGIAKHEGINQAVHLRAAMLNGNSYIHLGDGTSKAVEITPTGWRVTNDVPVKFWQSSAMQSLPTPSEDGNVELLWKYVNVNDKDRLLVLAWILESFRPETPFLVLAISGQQGSAKSSSQDKIRQLVDNNSVNLRVTPKSTEDIFVGAGMSWVVSFENLSHLTPAMQDALCTLATGGGYASRKLFTNDEENIISVKRPVIINSIPHVITAQDLTDRAINIEAPRVSGYLEVTEINKAWEIDKPIIFGGLMDLFVNTLKGIDSVKNIDNSIRMIDFTRLGESMARSLGHDEGHFTSLYKANRLEGLSRSLEASPVVVALIELVENHHGGLQVFHGVVKKLYLDLTSAQAQNQKNNKDGWVRSPRGLTEAIKRHQPALKEIGITVIFGNKVERLGHERGYLVTITKTGNYTPHDYENAKSGDDI